MTPAAGRRAGTAPRALFVSDLHLCAAVPARTRVLLDWLAGPARGVRDLFVLGDLFDLWIGDTGEEPAAQVSEAFAALSRAGTRVWLMPGNRDFLLDENFARRAGATLLPDPAPVEIDGTPIVLSHGDLLCTADRGYLRLRRVLRSHAVRALLLRLPPWLRRYLARGLRAASRRALARKSSAITDAQPEACDALLARHDCAWLIHGHTHRPGVHHHGRGTRLVLGAWEQEPWVLEWPVFAAGGAPGARRDAASGP